MRACALAWSPACTFASVSFVMVRKFVTSPAGTSPLPTTRSYVAVTDEPPDSFSLLPQWRAVGRRPRRAEPRGHSDHGVVPVHDEFAEGVFVVMLVCGFVRLLDDVGSG